MIDYEEHPDYVCTMCDWKGDEPGTCGHCYALICPRCCACIITYEEYDTNQRNNENEE